MHVVDGMKAKMLIGMDVIGPEKITLDIPRRTAFIGSCKDAAIPITVTPRSNQRVSRPVKAGKNITIPPHSHMMIPIQEQDLPSDRDLLFEPVDHSDGIAIYAHIVDCNMAIVYARNDSESPINLHQDTLLGTVTEYEVDTCFRAHPTVAPLAAPNDLPNQSTVIRDVFAMATEIALEEASANPLNKKERKMENGVTIYGDQEDYVDFRALVEDFRDLFNDNGGVVDVPEEEWMEIPLIENWRDIYKPNQAKVYSLGTKDRQVVDKLFDKLHQENLMEWTRGGTAFTYPCFVVWRTVNGEQKGRVVVDIRALNKITSPDTYPVPSQADILNAIVGSKFITTVDCSSFFYQWRVRKEHRHRLTVASHRGQETFKVAVMGFRNSPAYVQRMIDNVLRSHRLYNRAYVDDITIFSMTKADHLQHLHGVFATLDQKNIKLAAKKSFVGYPSIHLLGQRVDALGLSTAEEKLAAITMLEFPKTLKDLETYLGMTGYLR